MHRSFILPALSALAFTALMATTPTVANEAVQSFDALGTRTAPTMEATAGSARDSLVRFAQAQPTTAVPPMKKFTVLLPFKVGITFYPISVADQLGYFKSEGIDLDLQVANGSSAVVQQLAAGNAQIGVILAPNTLLGFAEGVKYKAFYDFVTKNTFDLKVLENSPINKLADLAGKKVGTIDLTRGDLPLLAGQLQKVGLTLRKDVQVIALGFNMAVQANSLKEGQVDALNISWNNAVGVEAAGIKLKCVTCDEAIQLASETTVVPDEILKRDRRYIVGFGRALAKATVFAEANPEAAIALMKKVAPQEQTDAAYTKTFFNAAVTITTPRKPGKYGLHDIAGWERLQTIMSTPVGDQPTGLQTKVDVNQLVTNELIDEINNFDAEAVRKQAKEYKP